MICERNELKTNGTTKADTVISLKNRLAKPAAAVKARAKHHFQPIDQILSRFDTMEDMFAAA